MSYYKEGHEIYVPRVEEVLKMTQITYERHLCTNTFTEITSWVLTLKVGLSRIFLGISGLPGVSGLSPDTLSLRVATTLFLCEDV
jgi:hypothetical protein